MVTAFKLSYQYEQGGMMFEPPVIPKVPFVLTSVTQDFNVVNVAGNIPSNPIAGKDVDIFDIAFIPMPLPFTGFIGSTGGAQPVGIPIAPNTPMVVLYDQTDNPSGTATSFSKL